MNQGLGLTIHFSDLDKETKRQDGQLARARSRSPQIDECTNRLESNLTLSEEENAELIKKIEDFLREGG